MASSIINTILKTAAGVATVLAAVAVPLSPAFANRPVVKTQEIITKKGELIDGISYPAGTMVRVVEGTKSVVNILLKSDFKMNGHVILAGSDLQVRAGKLISFFTAEGQKINGILLPAESQVNFDGHDNVQMISPGRAIRIRGKTYPGHEWIGFGATGEAIRMDAD